MGALRRAAFKLGAAARQSISAQAHSLSQLAAEGCSSSRGATSVRARTFSAAAAKGSIPPGSLTPSLVPAAQAVARIVVQQGTVPVASSALWLGAKTWLQYLGLGTLATGAGLFAENHRRSLLPDVCSSHGRTCIIEGSQPLAASMSVAYVRRVAQLAYRAAYLYLLFAPVVLAGLVLYVAPGSDRLCRLWYTMLRRTLEQGGSAFIKWGQWASTRTDIFPVDLCRELVNLHSGAPVHSLEYTKGVIKAELGQPIELLFDEFEPEPVASGSVAQVYRATYQGQPVAVKVRHPKVEEQIRDDFQILGWLVSGLAKLQSFQWLNLEESLKQFSHTMADQVMLDAEARHLTRFIHLFKGREGVSFPVPKYPLVAPAVLVESFEFATGVTDGINSDLSPIVRRYIVRQGTQIYLQMLLADNFMHADLHPGNILLRHKTSGEEAPQLVLVDAGMVAQLEVEEQENFIGLFQAIGAGDGEQAASRILSFTKEQTCSDIEGFVADMRQLFEHSCKGYNTGVDIGEVVRGCLNVVRDHQVRVDANYATLLVNVLCIEGLGRQMMPDYNILDSAKPMLEAHRMMGTKALAYVMPLWSIYSAVVDRVLWWEHRVSQRLAG